MPTICAIIVTFNRKLVLADCIRSILDGERVPERIIVVDNASTDGTADFIETNFPTVSVLRLQQNKGGAGGFKAGIEEALLLGADLLWIMDDDHVLQPATLRDLAAAIEKFDTDVAGPLILAPSSDGRLSWPMGPGGQGYLTVEAIEHDYGAQGFIPQFPSPFNATLYRRGVFEKVGLPDERLFIRGDETEFTFRMEQHGISSVAVVCARVVHPTAVNEYRVVLTLGKARLNVYYTGNRLKDYCIFRNRAFNYRKYRRWKSLLLDPLRYGLFFVMTRRLDLDGLRLWMRAYRDGLLGQFGYERQLLS